MTQIAKVVKIENGKTYVMIKRTSACTGDCKSCSGCETKPIICEAVNNKDAKCGDDVVIFSDTKKTLYLAFKLYVLPIIILICALFLYEAFAFSIYVLSAALAVLAVLWFVLLKKSKTPSRTVLEVISK